jgi:hypothetical protein
MKKLLFIDSMIFDLLITLSFSNLGKILECFDLATTDINQLELSRMPDKEKLNEIEGVIKQYFRIIPAKIFSFARYNQTIFEDSSGGFGGGRWLGYEDVRILNIIGKEGEKSLKGRAYNDQAIVLALSKHPGAILVTNEPSLAKKVKACGMEAISFNELINFVGISGHMAPKF